MTREELQKVAIASLHFSEDTYHQVSNINVQRRYTHRFDVGTFTRFAAIIFDKALREAPFRKMLLGEE